MTDITTDDVRALIDSRAINAAMVRYPDGSIDVRSTIPTNEPALDDYEVIIPQSELSQIDQSGMDFDNLADDDLEALAACLNSGEGDS